MTWAAFFVALGAFGVLETAFVSLADNDAGMRLVKAYPEFALELAATLLALLVTSVGISAWLSLKLRKKPAPAIEVVQAERGRFLP